MNRAFEKLRGSRKEQWGIERAKRDHEMSMVCRINEHPKAFYTYINKKRMARDRVGSFGDEGGNLWMEPEEVGKVLYERHNKTADAGILCTTNWWRNRVSQAATMEEMDM